MLTRLAAQELVDGLAAVSLGAAALAVARQGPASPQRARLGFAFGGLCLFFAARAGFEALDWRALRLLSLVVVCVLPLAALVLAEGVLRRHAPRALKALVTAGGLAVALVLLAAGGESAISRWALGGYVVLSLASVTLLLAARDRASLSRQENAGVDALLAAGALLTAASVTDFLAAAPLGLSGVGAASVALVVAANPSSAREARAVLAGLVAMGVAAALLALAFAGPFGLASADEQVRFGAGIVALLLAASVVPRTRGRGPGGAAADFARGLAAADTGSLERFLGALADQPLLAGLRIAEGGQLVEYDAKGLGQAMQARAVWTPATLADAAMPERARDELGDLMARTEATHALALSRAPLRIALLTLPGVGPTDQAEASLALFQRLAAVAAQDRA